MAHKSGHRSGDKRPTGVLKANYDDKKVREHHGDRCVSSPGIEAPVQIGELHAPRGGGLSASLSNGGSQKVQYGLSDPVKQQPNTDTGGESHREPR